MMAIVDSEIAELELGIEVVDQGADRVQARANCECRRRRGGQLAGDGPGRDHECPMLIVDSQTYNHVSGSLNEVFGIWHQARANVSGFQKCSCHPFSSSICLHMLIEHGDQFWRKRRTLT